MCLSAGFSLLFFVGAAWNLLHGDKENALAGFIAGCVLAVFAIALAREEGETEKFISFIGENEEKLREGGSISYSGKAISLSIEVTQFYFCLSFIIFTMRLPSRFFIRRSQNTLAAGSIYSLVTLILGWWGIPFGPIYTINALYKNLRGGDKRQFPNCSPR